MTYALLAALALFSLGPLVIFLFNALKSQSELASNPLGPPQSWRWESFLDAWTQANMAVGFRNSAIIVGGTIVGVCLIASCAAYAMARLSLPGRGGVIMYLLVSSTLPIQMFLVPLFFLWSQIGLYDRLIGLILIYCAVLSPFATLLLRAFLVNLPRDYEEAARLDGAGELTILRKLTLPMVLPGLLTVALITGLGAYNEFLLAVTFLEDQNKMPISTSLFAFQQGYTQNYALVSAAGLVMLAPLLALFLALQRKFTEGITFSGLGG